MSSSDTLTTASTTSTGAKITTSTISSAPIAVNSASTTTASIRAIGTSRQATQLRIVMPSNLMAAASPMLNQIESAAVAASGRAQITAIPAAASGAARTVSNTSITVARPITQTTYLPRASVTATQMTGVGVATTATGQRLVTPIRATPASGVTGTTVTGLMAGGSFVRSGGAGATVSRNSASPATTVISPATSTTWMAANNAGQVQLIRAISHQPRQRIITTQSLNTASTGGTGAAAAGAAGVLSGTVVAAATIGTANAVQGNPTTSTQPSQQTQPQQQQTQSGTGQSTLQSVATSQQQPQPTYVATLATVLPPRQHQATLVYSSNVGNATAASAGGPPAGTVTQTLAQTQQFSPTLTTGQRFAVATSLTAGTAANNSAGAPRQIRQMSLAKPISTTKLSTASISIRAPNLPQLAPTLAAAATGSGLSVGTGGGTGTPGAITTGTASVNARSSSVTGVTGSTVTASVIPGGNLPTTRIIQLQQQPGGTAQQIIGSTGRLTGNVMFQPFIVNTTGSNKIGVRPPVTMAAKGQPSLTITHMGISKLSTTVAGATITAGGQAQTVAAGLQGLNSGVNTGTGNIGTGTTATATGSVLATTSTSVGSGSNVVASSAPTNLASTTGLLTTQNVVSSAAGGATVVPLAIAARGGTLTSIKNASGVTVGKVMTAAASSAGTAVDGSNNNPTGANVFIQQQQQQRPGSVGSSGVTSSSSTSAATTLSSSSTISTTAVVTSSSNFLQPGSTIYYESVPASNVQVSTGVLSITTTTLTSSTMAQQQTATAASSSSSAGLGITSSAMPFVTHAANSTTSFTVVSSSGGNAGVSGPRTISQLQLPISSSGTGVGTQIQAVRFSAPLTTATVSDAATGAQQQVLTAAQVGGGNPATGSNVTVPQQMVIPLQTSIKVTTTAGVPGSTVVSNFLRKRDNVDGSLPIRAAKNLGPTLISMSSATASPSPSSVSSPSSIISGISTASSISATTAVAVLPQPLSPAPSTSSSFSTVSSSGFGSANSGGSAPQLHTTGIALTVEALTKKDRVSALASTPPRCSRGASPASSEGSTTVSANSSPGVEQQMAQDESAVVAMQHGNHHRGDSNNTHFNPIHELYPFHHQQQHKSHHQIMVDGVQQQQPQQHSSIQGSHNVGHRNPSDNQNLHLAATTSSTSMSATNMPQRGMNGGTEGPPRKRSRRGTNDSQQSNQSQPSSSSLSLPPPAVTGLGIDYNATINNSVNAVVQSDDIASSNNNHTSTNQVKANAANNNPPQPAGNKENAKPIEYFLRRPRNCTLMNSYKANWKTANNHFQRYTDVKQREERRPTVIDVANQVNIQNKLGGWKVYHLRAQMEDLAENEESTHDHLNEMLKQMETHEKTPDMERICELLKANKQRNRVIVDGINEAKNQIMKIFDHQSHVSDILSRCASKRNFKKREKV